MFSWKMTKSFHSYIRFEAGFLRLDALPIANADQQYSGTECFFLRHHLTDAKISNIQVPDEPKNQNSDTAEGIYRPLLGP